MLSFVSQNRAALSEKIRGGLWPCRGTDGEEGRHGPREIRDRRRDVPDKPASGAPSRSLTTVTTDAPSPLSIGWGYGKSWALFT